VIDRIVNQALKSYSRMKFRGKVGEDVNIHWQSQINGNVYVDKHTNINGPCYLSGTVEIGKWCAIAHGFRARSTNHEIKYANMQAKLSVRYGFRDVHGVSKGPIQIDHACWIGDRVTVLSGVHVGSGAVLGAWTVVTKDVPPFAIIAGCPGRIVKMRFEPQVIEALLDVSWWDWSEDQISRNKKFFEADLTCLHTRSEVLELLVD
jgi:virginiamycin A acetyltransferase